MDNYTAPTEYERMILRAMQNRPMYQGFAAARVLPAKRGLPERVIEDPRIARVNRLAAKR